jgi:hypothetical protein
MLPSTSQAGSTDSAGSRSASTAAVEGLSRIILSLSDGWRVVVVVAMVAIAGAIAYLKLIPRVDPTDPLRSAAYLTGGVPDPKHAGADTQNPQNVEAAHSAEEAQAALQWHFEHKSDDDPPEVAIADSHIFYRYYSRSDHCLYIRRHNGDSELTQWVSDPNYHQHSTHAPGRIAGFRADSDVPLVTRSVGLALAGLVPTLLAASATETTPPLVMVGQRGCMNPHPGTFRYWWGQPMDRCNSPMYREFADGCVHYQIYNRCANAWNSQINWTACVQQHRW